MLFYHLSFFFSLSSWSFYFSVMDSSVEKSSFLIFLECKWNAILWREFHFRFSPFLQSLFHFFFEDDWEKLIFLHQTETNRENKWILFKKNDSRVVDDDLEEEFNLKTMQKIGISSSHLIKIARLLHPHHATSFKLTDEFCSLLYFRWYSWKTQLR